MHSKQVFNYVQRKQTGSVDRSDNVIPMCTARYVRSGIIRIYGEQSVGFSSRYSDPEAGNLISVVQRYVYSIP